MLWDYCATTSWFAFFAFLSVIAIKTMFAINTSDASEHIEVIGFVTSTDTSVNTIVHDETSMNASNVAMQTSTKLTILNAFASPRDLITPQEHNNVTTASAMPINASAITPVLAVFKSAYPSYSAARPLARLKTDTPSQTGTNINNATNANKPIVTLSRITNFLFIFPSSCPHYSTGGGNVKHFK